MDANAQNTAAKITEAQLAIEKRDYKNAKNVLDEIPDAEKSQQPLFYYYYAKASEGLENYQEAINNFNKYLEYVPGNVDITKAIAADDYNLRMQREKEENNRIYKAQKQADLNADIEKKRHDPNSAYFYLGQFNNNNIKIDEDDPIAAIPFIDINIDEKEKNYLNENYLFDIKIGNCKFIVPIANLLKLVFDPPGLQPNESIRIGKEGLYRLQVLNNGAVYTESYVNNFYYDISTFTLRIIDNKLHFNVSRMSRDSFPGGIYKKVEANKKKVKLYVYESEIILDRK